MDQNSISYQETFNTFNNPAITKPFNVVKSTKFWPVYEYDPYQDFY